MIWPTITVVTPSFNSEKWIEFTIQSVLNQEYPNLEYIVLDGAGDRTWKILKKYENQLAYWRSHPDCGQYAAINEGFALATGDILCWLNADDLLLPRSLFVVAEIFSTLPEVEWLSTLKPGSWGANGYLSDVGSIPGFAKAAFLDGLFLPGLLPRGYWIQQESTFFTARLWRRAGASVPPYGLAGDFALWCEFYKHAQLFGCAYPLSGFRHVRGQRLEARAEYLREASAALVDLRLQQCWQPSPYWRLLYGRTAKLPKVKGLIRERFGYAASVVENKEVKKPGAEWLIKKYKFLP
jgi:glycosyltransferase involved in cell wall biosynthesis